MTGDRRRSRARTVAAAVTLLSTALLTSGCLRAQVAAAVGSDDTVTGEIVIASVATDPADPGAELSPPDDLSSRVRTEPYRQDDYAGTRLLFDGLTFDEFGRLTESAGGEGGRLRMQLRRAGDLVLFTGRVDLIDIEAPERTDVDVRMSFPGRVTATNGALKGNEITWEPPAGQVTDLSATVRYADPTAAPWTHWAALVGGLAGLGVLAVLVLAFVAHRMSMREPAQT